MNPYQITHVVRLNRSSSTNDDVLQLLASREGNALVWTLHQTAGRGTRGRTWLTPENRGLALSIGLQGDLPQPAAFCYPLFAGVLLHECLFTLSGEAGLSLKWPNDLLFRGRKLAGILCESRWRQNRLQVVLGMGINLKPHAEFESLPKPYTSIDAFQRALSAETIVGELCARLPEALANLTPSYRLREAWLKHGAHPVGTPVKLHAYGEEWLGLFEGLDEQGGMLIRLNTGKLKHIRQTCDDFRILVE